MLNPTIQIIKSVAHLLYPQICPGCGIDSVNSRQLLCVDCFENLPVTNFHMHANNPVEKIFWGRIPVVAATSFMYFTKDSMLQKLLHEFKYNGRKEIGSFLSNIMALEFMQSNRFRYFDGVVPLPLHGERLRRRGYNQAEVIARSVTETLQIPLLDKLVRRRSSTDTQTKKNRQERWDNIEGKFELTNTEDGRDKHLLLVDDVTTTGATLEACARELFKISGVRLSIATLAFTQS